MAKTYARYVCRECGYQSPKWIGKCPECEQWNTFDEEVVSRSSSSAGKGALPVYTPPVLLSDVVIGEHHRYSSGIKEFDRVLGGGIVPGSVVLIGGDPGIGKSTLLTQTACNLSAKSKTTLYVSGEESAEQIKLRANRLNIRSDKLYIASETDIEQVESIIQNLKPGAVIIDSIQTMRDSALESAPATVGQVRACTTVLTKIAKGEGIPIFIVGHVTKEGAIAGPRVLEHIVDTVLYFEGDKHLSYRMLRAVKNRFGSTDELGMFEMGEDGLQEVANPSEILLSERPINGSGSVISAAIEGSRPLLIEVQALVAPSYFAAPRRMAAGVDYNRTMLILAILEKRAGFSFANQDVYVNVAGGVKVTEPSLDLAIAAAIASSHKDMPVDKDTIVMGELGLAGEVRGISQTEKRIKEASRLGFNRVIMPAHNCRKGYDSIQITGVQSVYKAIETAIGVFRRKTRKAEEPEE
jgi:DNA repair protein RadA/Sms